MQSNFWIPFLLQVGDNGLPNELGSSDHVKHFVVLSVDKRELEFELGRIDAQHAGAAFSVQAIDAVSLDSGDIDGKVERTNYSVIPTIPS